MKKISAFDDQFGEEPLSFDNNTYVISRDAWTKEEVFEIYKQYFADWGQHEDGGSRFQSFTIDDIQEDRVRFRLDWEDGERQGMWFLGATGKGSKPVWVLELRMRPRNNER